MADELPLHCKWLRTLPCCACAYRAPSEVHHHIGAGMGLKSHDARAIPLCTQCHRDYHDHNGIFRTMNRAQKLAWHGEKLALVSERVMHANEHDLAEEWDGVF